VKSFPSRMAHRELISVSLALSKTVGIVYTPSRPRIRGYF